MVDMRKVWEHEAGVMKNHGFGDDPKNNSHIENHTTTKDYPFVLDRIDLAWRWEFPGKSVDITAGPQ